MKTPWLRLIAFAGLLTLVGGCASSSASRDLDLQVVNLQLAGATAFETTATFTIRIENEGTGPVQLTGGVFKFSLDGRQIGKGLWDGNVEIPRLASTNLLVSVHLRNLTMATRIRSIAEAQTTTIGTDATLYVLSGTRERTAKITKESRLDARDFTSPKN